MILILFMFTFTIIAENAYSPSWSSDGRFIAYHAYYGKREKIFLYDFKTGVTRKITLGESDDWHPDFHNGYIYFDSDTGGGRAIYRIKLSGGKPERIISGLMPKLSESGKIAFLRKAKKLWSLWIMDGKERILIKEGVWGLSWCSDNKLAFGLDSGIFILDSGKIRFVANGRTPGCHKEKIAFAKDGKVFVLQGGRIVKVADVVAEEFDWSPDGSRLAFHAKLGEIWKVVIIRVGEVSSLSSHILLSHLQSPSLFYFPLSKHLR